MTELAPAPSAAAPPPPKKRARIPWVQLMAITALAAVVIAVLIPTYGDYSDRAQVSQAFTVLGGAKTPLAEYYANNKKWPPTLADVYPDARGKHVQAAAITRGAGGNGEIELTATLAKEGVDRRVAGKSVRLLSADGGKTWVCRAGTVREISLPAACRASQ